MRRRLYKVDCIDRETAELRQLNGDQGAVNINKRRDENSKRER